MALVWNWKDKCGEMCVVQSHLDEEDQMFTVDLYQGNAYLIMIHEFKEAGKDKYSVFSFFVDKAHMRTCLGLDKKGIGRGNEPPPYTIVCSAPQSPNFLSATLMMSCAVPSSPRRLLSIIALFVKLCKARRGELSFCYQKERIAPPASDLKWKGQIIVRPKM